MNLSEFIEESKRDRNLFWRLQSGEHQNLLDEAIERIEELEGYQAEKNNKQQKIFIPKNVWVKIERKARECQRNWGMGFPVISITLLKSILKSEEYGINIYD